MLAGAFRTEVKAVAYRTLFSMTSKCCMGARFHGFLEGPQSLALSVVLCQISESLIVLYSTKVCVLHRFMIIGLSEMIAPAQTTPLVQGGAAIISSIISVR